MLVVDQTTKPITSKLPGSDDGLLGLPLDVSQIINTATSLTGSGNADIFQKALEQVNSQHAIGSLNDQAILSAHKQVYGGGLNVSGVDSSSIGAAAALESLKSMVSGVQRNPFTFDFSHLFSSEKER